MKKIYIEICNKFNLGNLKHYEQIDGGLTNKMIKLTTTKGKYALKILNNTNKETLNKIEFSEYISNVANDNNIFSVTALKFNNKYIQQYKNIYFLIYYWIDGKILKSKEITISHIKIIATELAKLHQINVDSEYNIKLYEKNNYQKYYNLLKDNNEEWTQYFLNNYDLLLKIYEDAYTNYLKLSSQKSYIHKDLNRKNIIWVDDKPNIIDFETVTIGNPSIDFFNSAWFLTDDVQYDKYYEFSKTYLSINKLVDNINVASYAAIIEECNWLYFSLKRALGYISNNPEEIEIGKQSIATSLKEIINYYNKIPLMLSILNEIKEDLQ